MARIDLENAIISAISQDYSLIEKFNITKELFKNINNTAIFEAAKVLSKYDYVMLSSSVSGDIFAHLQTITNSNQNHEFILNYILELKKLDKRETIKQLLMKFDEAPIEEIISQLQDLTGNIITERPTNHIKNLSQDYYKQLEIASETPDTLKGVTSGLKRVDSYLWGFQKGVVYLLAGRPSMGKSAVGLNFAINAAMSGKRVYIQALEETSSSIMSRATSRLANISNENLNKGKIEAEQWHTLAGTVSKISGLDVMINDSTNLTSNQIIKLIKREHTIKPLDLVIVDHIQETNDKAENRRLSVTQAASNLRSMAKSLNVPVIIVSQLNRASETRNDKTPMLSDLRESGDLEQIADVIMLLFREGYYNKELSQEIEPLEIIFAKNRNGRTGKITVGFKLDTLTVINEPTVDILGVSHNYTDRKLISAQN